MLGSRLALLEDRLEAVLSLAPLLFGQFPQTLIQSRLDELNAWFVAQAREPGGASESYGRRVLFADKNLEIMLAKWRPQMECLPHDHGFSSGRVVAVAGTFTESDFGWRDGELCKLNQRQIEFPSVMQVNPVQTHSMRCESELGLTLHVYRPAIREMKVFDLEKKCTFLVTDDCGAWAPQPHQIISSEPWARGSK